MSDDRKVMHVGLVVAAMVLVVRIVLEQTGAPERINNIFGVAWLYFIVPVLFALGIRRRGYARPFAILLKDVVLFAVYTRVMVMITYMLAYLLRWNAPRFASSRGGSVWTGLVFIPARNVLIWVVMATVVGMIIGSVALALGRKPSTPAAAARPKTPLSP